MFSGRPNRIVMFHFPLTAERYLVVVGFTVGQALAFVVTVSQEGFLTLSTHKMLQTNKQTHPQPGTRG